MYVRGKLRMCYLKGLVNLQLILLCCPGWPQVWSSEQSSFLPLFQSTGVTGMNPHWASTTTWTCWLTAGLILRDSPHQTEWRMPLASSLSPPYPPLHPPWGWDSGLVPKTPQPYFGPQTQFESRTELHDLLKIPKGGKNFLNSWIFLEWKSQRHWAYKDTKMPTTNCYYCSYRNLFV